MQQQASAFAPKEQCKASGKLTAPLAWPRFLYHRCNPSIPLEMIAMERDTFPNPSFSKLPACSCLVKSSLEPIETALHRAVIENRTAAVQSFGKHAGRGLHIPPGCYHRPSGHRRRTWQTSPALNQAAQACKCRFHVHSSSGCF